ncbi:hypothetical protein L1987_57472 [Smallanthus sonchifolius]|uniref:Uncharacterized protein n=1 Tax=Smallanthus sonchifolius TaxID=185202 RepID=A0ACB9DCX6_9ASTR|nr:hypothetical protein L1987_57472 [Smallanthus sonchifolius]
MFCFLYLFFCGATNLSRESSIMAIELLETLKEAITANTRLTLNAFFTFVAAGVAVYYVFSVLVGGSSDHHQQQHLPRSFEEDVQSIPPPVQLVDISEEELKAYDGNDPQKPLLMAIKGQINDVSQSSDAMQPILFNLFGHRTYEWS